MNVLGICSVILLSFRPQIVIGQEKSLIAFGGNGNIGSEVLHQLIATQEFHRIYTVFRSGQWYFDSDVRIAPQVTYLQCDRAKDPPCSDQEDNEELCDINSLKLCPDLMKVINETTFDVVLDFSAYEPKWVRDVLGVIRMKEDGLYVYISTDSVYEVSKPKTTRRPSLETDAVRPDDFKIRDQLKSSDMYGHSKLAGEEALREHEGSLNWVSLRLADVIGPRDTTRRLWLYILWLKFYSSIGEPLYIPPEVRSLEESLTYVKDVGRVIGSVLKAGRPSWNEAYNVALEGSFTLENILSKTAETLGIAPFEYEFEHKDSPGAFHLFPTVTRGSMSIDKARERLGFEPTGVDEAFRDAVEWSLETFVQNEEEREEMISRLLTYVAPKDSKDVLKEIDGYLAEEGVWTKRFVQSKRGESEEL